VSATAARRRLTFDGGLRAAVRRLARLGLDERAARSRRTFLGRYWSVLLPLLESGAFALVFGALLGVRGTSSAYFSFAYVGLFAWRIFARGLVASAGATGRHADLLHTFPVPVGSVIAPSVGAAFLDGLVGVPVLLGAVLLLEGVPELGGLLIWVLLGAALHLLTTLGLGLLVGVVNSFYRDMGIVVTPLLTILMFAAPVVYPAALVPDPWRLPFLANPIAAAIESFRVGLLGTDPPPPLPLALASVIAVAIVGLGWGVARRYDSRVREVL
jgi:lipopolysaccharide transport system permease protein